MRVSYICDFLKMANRVIVINMQEAIAAAKSLEEVQQLEAMLKAGQLPLQSSSYQRVQNGGQFVEQDMDN